MSGAPAICDPGERRETPLLAKIRRHIRTYGPMPVASYFKLCLWDKDHGYYATRAPLGQAGDFTTAPEISQIFGELTGLWAAAVWRTMGAPPSVSLVEYGPGRGTLLRDALRALRLVPEFLAAANVVLVEASPALAAEQRRTLAGAPCPVSWTDSVLDFAAPAIVIANEFLDAWPVTQWEMTEDGWKRRAVGLSSEGNLVFTRTDGLPRPGRTNGLRQELQPGTIVEERDLRLPVQAFAAAAAGGPFAALVIDYGYTGASRGSTLEAVRRHGHEHPLASPGEADLSAHVDFTALAAALRSHGLAVDGPAVQAEFLGALGAVERAGRLMSANPARAGEIEAGAARLLAPSGMGTRFKCLGVRSPGLPPLPGLPPQCENG